MQAEIEKCGKTDGNRQRWTGRRRLAEMEKDGKAYRNRQRWAGRRRLAEMEKDGKADEREQRRTCKKENDARESIAINLLFTRG